MDLKIGKEREKYELSVIGMLTPGEEVKLALLDSWRGNRWWEDGLRDLGKCVPLRPNERS